MHCSQLTISGLITNLNLLIPYFPLHFIQKVNSLENLSPLKFSTSVNLCLNSRVCHFSGAAARLHEHVRPGQDEAAEAPAANVPGGGRTGSQDANSGGS